MWLIVLSAWSVSTGLWKKLLPQFCVETVHAWPTSGAVPAIVFMWLLTVCRLSIFGHMSVRVYYRGYSITQ